MSSVPPGWFRRPGRRSRSVYYWDGRRWTGAARPDRERADPVRVLWACLAAVAAVVGFVAVVLTLKGGVAAILLVGYAVWGWLALRRRRAARRR